MEKLADQKTWKTLSLAEIERNLAIAEKIANALPKDASLEARVLVAGDRDELWFRREVLKKKDAARAEELANELKGKTSVVTTTSPVVKTETVVAPTAKPTAESLLPKEEEKTTPEVIVPAAELKADIFEQVKNDIENNKKVIDGLMDDAEKNTVAVEAVIAQTGEIVDDAVREAMKATYTDESRTYLLNETQKAEEGKEYNKRLKEIVAKVGRGIRKSILLGMIAIVTGTSVLAGAGFGADGDGDGKIKWNANNIVPNVTSILPKAQSEQARRLAEKVGLYKSPDVQITVNEDSIQQARLIQQQKEEQARIFAAEKTTEDSVENMAKYKESLKVFQVIGTVPDSYNRKDSLFSYRSQWTNDEGFRYIPAPNKGNRNAGNVRYTNVIGVGHFLLDADLSQGRNYMHEFDKSYIKRAKERNEYIPIFTRLADGSIRMQYKRGQEVTKDDHIADPLRQFTWDQLNWKATKPAKGFLSGIQEVSTTTGADSYLLLTNRNSYTRFSGGSVVFIFHDKYGNQIVRDFAGSNKQIENEGNNILTEFGIEAKDLVIGYHDVGSFSAKPKAHNGTLNIEDQAGGFNNYNWTGGALLIPSDVLAYAK